MCVKVNTTLDLCCLPESLSSEFLYVIVKSNEPMSFHALHTHTPPHGFRYLNETRLRSGVTEVISHLQTRSQANGISINVFSFGQVSSEWNADVKLRRGPHHEEAWLLQRQNENQLLWSLNTSRKKTKEARSEKRGCCRWHENYNWIFRGVVLWN